jgi:hypothetical protein
MSPASAPASQTSQPASQWPQHLGQHLLQHLGQHLKHLSQHLASIWRAHPCAARFEPLSPLLAGEAPCPELDRASRTATRAISIVEPCSGVAVQMSITTPTLFASARAALDVSKRARCSGRSCAVVQVAVLFVLSPHDSPSCP